MANMQDTISIMQASMRENPSQSIYLSGPPGVGKTSICFTVAEQLDIPQERILLFRPSLRDPVDLMGVPSVSNGATSFNPPAELAQFREGTGPGLIIWDELAQGSVMMQNAIAGCLLDRELGGLHLDREVMQVATGNRTSDRAGANRVVSQLANRVLHLSVEVTLDDWTRWALSNSVDPLLVAFIRLRPALLFDFDPDRFCNATPRSWEMVSRLPSSLQADDSLYQTAVSGLVGEGAAAEWVGTRHIMGRMPNIQSLLSDPLGSEVPSEAAVRFAVATAMTRHVSEASLGAAMQYMARMPKEFEALFMDLLVKSVGKNDSWVVNHPSFLSWACDSDNQRLMLD